ncbi:MAG: hypothetical protein LUI87_17690, partial [Lachnospiraceae bacterium]|nr:hypothetical protein [Lachnospiraceae bacterium]
AQRNQKEAEKKVQMAEYQLKKAKEKYEMETKQRNNEMKKRIKKMKEKEFFWIAGYGVLVFFILMQNTII